MSAAVSQQVGSSATQLAFNTAGAEYLTAALTGLTGREKPEVTGL